MIHDTRTSGLCGLCHRHARLLDSDISPEDDAPIFLLELVDGSSGDSQNARLCGSCRREFAQLVSRIYATRPHTALHGSSS